MSPSPATIKAVPSPGASALARSVFQPSFNLTSPNQLLVMRSYPTGAQVGPFKILCLPISSEFATTWSTHGSQVASPTGQTDRTLFPGAFQDLADSQLVEMTVRLQEFSAMGHGQWVIRGIERNILGETAESRYLETLVVITRLSNEPTLVNAPAQVGGAEVRNIHINIGSNITMAAKVPLAANVNVPVARNQGPARAPRRAAAAAAAANGPVATIMRTHYASQAHAAARQASRVPAAVQHPPAFPAAQPSESNPVEAAATRAPAASVTSHQVNQVPSIATVAPQSVSGPPVAAITPAPSTATGAAAAVRRAIFPTTTPSVKITPVSAAPVQDIPPAPTPLPTVELEKDNLVAALIRNERKRSISPPPGNVDSAIKRARPSPAAQAPPSKMARPLPSLPTLGSPRCASAPATFPIPVIMLTSPAAIMPTEALRQNAARERSRARAFERFTPIDPAPQYSETILPLKLGPRASSAGATMPGGFPAHGEIDTNAITRSRTAGTALPDFERYKLAGTRLNVATPAPTNPTEAKRYWDQKAAEETLARQQQFSRPASPVKGVEYPPRRSCSPVKESSGSREEHKFPPRPPSPVKQMIAMEVQADDESEAYSRCQNSLRAKRAHKDNDDDSEADVDEGGGSVKKVCESVCFI